MVVENIKLISNLIYFISGKVEIIDDVQEIFRKLKELALTPNQDGELPILKELKSKALNRFIYALDCMKAEADWVELAKEHNSRLEF